MTFDAKFWRPFHSKITRGGIGLEEGFNRRKCVLTCYLFTEMKCILLRFPTYVTGSSLAEIVKMKIQGFHIKMM